MRNTLIFPVRVNILSLLARLFFGISLKRTSEFTDVLVVAKETKKLFGTWALSFQGLPVRYNLGRENGEMSERLCGGPTCNSFIMKSLLYPFNIFSSLYSFVSLPSA